MKKFVALLGAVFLSVTLLQAKDDLQGNLSNLLKDRVKSEIKISSTKTIKTMPGFKLVVVELLSNGDRFPVIASDKGDFAMSYNPNAFLSNNEEFNKVGDAMMKELQSYMQELQAKRDKEKIPKFKELFSSLPKDTIIDIKGKGKGKAVKYVVTDPECPYCRKEMGNIEKVLEKYNLKMVMAPVHKKPAFIKSQLIYNEAKKAKEGKEIVGILKKYYSPNYQLTAEDQKTDTHTVDEAAKAIFSSGLIRGVPFCFDPETGKVGCGI